MGRRLKREGIYIHLELTPSGARDKDTTCQCRRQKRHGFNLWVRKIPRGRAWQPTPVFFFVFFFSPLQYYCLENRMDREA